MTINLNEVFNNHFKKTGVYIIENIENSKCYVGSSKNILKRWKEHIRMLQNGNHHSAKLQNSFNKYEEGKFQFKIILECPDECLEGLEQWYLSNLTPWYNMTLVAIYNNSITGNTGECNSKFKKGHIPTESNKKLSSLANKGNKYCLGYKHPEEFLNTLRKPIIQYDKNENFIREWNSIKEAAESIDSIKTNKTISGNIYNCLKNLSKSAYGYRWKYK